MYKARISVTLKPSILDPRGKASHGALKNLGFHTIEAVRMGKIIDLDIEADSEHAAKEVASHAARKLLANEVMEDFEVEILGAS